jgi:hypothetical protein
MTQSDMTTLHHAARLRQHHIHMYSDDTSHADSFLDISHSHDHARKAVTRSQTSKKRTWPVHPLQCDKGSASRKWHKVRYRYTHTTKLYPPCLHKQNSPSGRPKRGGRLNVAPAVCVRWDLFDLHMRHDLTRCQVHQAYHRDKVGF